MSDFWHKDRRRRHDRRSGADRRYDQRDDDDGHPDRRHSTDRRVHTETKKKILQHIRNQYWDTLCSHRPDCSFASQEEGAALSSSTNPLFLLRPDGDPLSQRLYHELIILAFLTYLNRQFSPLEYDKIYSYITSYYADIPLTLDHLRSYLQALHVTHQAFEGAVSDLLAIVDIDHLGHFVTFCTDLVLTSGFVSEKEKLFLMRLFKILEDEGIDIHLPE